MKATWPWRKLSIEAGAFCCSQSVTCDVLNSKIGGYIRARNYLQVHRKFQNRGICEIEMISYHA